ncbi:MAG: TolA multi-domain protein [Herbaspirillum sp.]|jgi:hypothetical protein|nr:TolA multi-domain protein [Herbaspirillum sp.]
MKKMIAATILGISALGFQSIGLAATNAATAEKTADKQADADYKVAKAKCDAMKGNDKDVCMKEAKAAQTSAKADAKAARKTGNARSDAAEDKNAANYKTAKEKCDAMSGNAKDACISKARADYKQ